MTIKKYIDTDSNFADLIIDVKYGIIKAIARCGTVTLYKSIKFNQFFVNDTSNDVYFTSDKKVALNIFNELKSQYASSIKMATFKGGDLTMKSSLH